MTTLNRQEVREELKAYREMGYTLQIALTASTEAMREEYNRIHALDNAPVADGYDYGDLTLAEIEEAGVTITEADTGKYINNEVKQEYSGYDYCCLEDRELNQILDDGTLLDNIHSRAFPPIGESYSVQGVVASLNAAGYETTNDRDSVTIFDVEGWISVYPDRLFFNFDGTYDMKMAASLGIDISNKSWLKDDEIDDEDISKYTGAFRYSVYVFSEAVKEYGFEDSFFSLKLAQDFIREQLHRTDKVDLRKELYLEGRWKCQKHVELSHT